MAEQKSDSPSVRITYYAMPGRAAPIRLACQLGGISYEDNFITSEEQKQQKADGKRRWSGPPEITIFDKNGKELVTIGQSNACLRYVGMFMYAHYCIQYICSYNPCTLYISIIYILFRSINWFISFKSS